MSDTRELRDRIRDIALEEFAEKGFFGASLAEIASRAGCTKQNVTYHFGSKQGLLTEACQRVDEQALQLVRDYGEGRVPDLLREIIQVVMQHSYGVAALLFYHRALPDDCQLTGIKSLIEVAAAKYAPGDASAQIRVIVALSGIAYGLVMQALGGPSNTHGLVAPGVTLTPDIAAELLRSLLVAPSATTVEPQPQEA